MNIATSRIAEREMIELVVAMSRPSEMPSPGADQLREDLGGAGGGEVAPVGTQELADDRPAQLVVPRRGLPGAPGFGDEVEGEDGGEQPHDPGDEQGGAQPERLPDEPAEEGGDQGAAPVDAAEDREGAPALGGRDRVGDVGVARDPPEGGADPGQEPHDDQGGDGGQERGEDRGQPHQPRADQHRRASSHPG